MQDDQEEWLGSMLKTLYVCSRMPVNLIDIKTTWKFCTKFIFNICKYIANFSLVVGAGIPIADNNIWNNKYHSGAWTIQLVTQVGLSYTLPPSYSRLRSSKSEQVAKTVWKDVNSYIYIKSTFIPSISLYYIVSRRFEPLLLQTAPLYCHPPFYLFSKPLASDSTFFTI